MGNTPPIYWVLSLIEYLRFSGNDGPIRFGAFGSWPLVRGLCFVAYKNKDI